MKKKHILKDRMLTKIELADDKMAIRFTTTQGEVEALCDGDCCSHTWVEDIGLPVNGLPAIVLDVVDVPMPSLDDSGELKNYGCKIVTDKGDVLIEYRNESNGYYGGDLSWPDMDDYFYGGVFGQNISKKVWKELT